MKKFNVTVNGTAYDVEVNEVKAAAPAAAPKAAPAAAPAPKALLHQHQLLLQQQLQFQQVLKL